jgi:methylmalonyl-CoA decarboxylase
MDGMEKKQADTSAERPLVKTKFTEEGIGILTMDHDERRNALSRRMVGEMLAAFDDFQRRGARVVILRANDDAKVWSAGHDIRELPIGSDPLHFSDPLERVIQTVKLCPCPVIAMVHGSVWGGATDVALSCDMIIGDETSSFAITSANIGLAYNTSGLLQFMRRLPLNLVKEMFFTAAPFPAQKALSVGILNHLRPADQLEAYTMEIAGLIVKKAPMAIAAIKEQLRLLTKAHPLSPESFERIQDLRQKVHQSADYREGVTAFLEKRKPVFKGE